MPLAVGARIAHYEITAPLGEGGMGQVYEALDTKLSRRVALKILPETFASSPDRLGRFQREAEVLASLNHAGIAAIYGIEEAGDTHALVLELVRGPTLADRITRGPIPVDETIAIAKQIADALEAAHGQGIIHRDLKPANVKVREDGTVKVLDFGIAKALGAPRSETETLASRTVSLGVDTEIGQVLGTAPYMSPEQARGTGLDRRADVWAFGAVVFEMLTGNRAFPGDDTMETLARIVEREPDWSALPRQVPPVLTAFLRQCLQKDVKQRVRDIGDVGLALDGAFDVPVLTASPSAARGWLPPGTVTRITGTAVVVSLVAGVLADRVWSGSGSGREAPGVTRLAVGVVDGHHLSGGFGLEEGEFARQRPSRASFALSPTGRELVYVASDGETSRLYRRPMDQAEAVAVAGTDGASAPFFSPDSRSVGFFVETELKRLSLDTGEVRTVSTEGPSFTSYGASWTTRDTILLSAGPVVYEVPSNGGRLSALTSPGGTTEPPVLYPELLPDGRTVLYNVQSSVVPTNWDIVLESTDTLERTVVASGSDPRYVTSGHIVFMRAGTLMAIPFDASRGETSGSPIVVIEDVMHSERGGNSQLNTGAGQFSVSNTGTLAFVAGGVYPVTEGALVMIDRAGAAEALPLPPGRYLWPRFSPDGGRLAYTAGAFGEAQIWVYDIDRRLPVRLTSEGENIRPVWSPDGTRLAFTRRRETGPFQLYWMPADGGGDPRPLGESDQTQVAGSWSRDDVLAFLQTGDIWTLRMDQDDAPAPFVETTATEEFVTFSPDGRWLAYTSDDTGRSEVYVRPFPDGQPVHRISANGGRSPVWSSDGRELLFLEEVDQGARLWTVEVDMDGGFAPGPARAVLERPDYQPSADSRSYDLSPDGRRLVLSTRQTDLAAQPVATVTIVLDWFEELNALVSVR